MQAVRVVWAKSQAQSVKSLGVTIGSITITAATATIVTTASSFESKVSTCLLIIAFTTGSIETVLQHHLRDLKFNLEELPEAQHCQVGATRSTLASLRLKHFDFEVFGALERQFMNYASHFSPNYWAK